MELFKIIKKVFDLTRNEIQQVIKDSKDYSKSLVDAEATRADKVVAQLETTTSDKLSYKVNSGSYVITNDISRGLKLDKVEELEILDAEFLEWNILRRIYIQGVVGKTNIGTFIFYDTDDVSHTYNNCSFFNLVDIIYKKGYSSSYNDVAALYNVQLLGTGDPLYEKYESLFESIKAKYISCKDIKDSYTGSCSKMLASCTNLRYTDFEIPSQGSNHSKVCYYCKNLVHKTLSINWPNSTNASNAFTYNEVMGKNMSNSLRVTLPVATTINSMFSHCINLAFSNGTIYAPLCSDAKQLFYYCTKIKQIDSIELQGGNMTSAFEECVNLKKVSSIVAPDEGQNVNLARAFYNCIALSESPEIQHYIYSLNLTFYNCGSLKSIPIYKLTETVVFGQTFKYCNNLADLGGFEGLIKSIDFTYSPLLTRESCLNIFNYAAEVTTSPSITLHSEAYAKLTEEDIAIAVNKGWTVQSA